jgi:L-rhamnose mutarotase
MAKRFCLTLDLKNDPNLIAEYKKFHESVWPEIEQTFRDAGIESLEIYLLGRHMFLILEGNEGFSLEKRAKSDMANPKVQEWETLMWKFQQALPQAKPGEKWLLMDRIYRYRGDEHPTTAAKSI